MLDSPEGVLLGAGTGYYSATSAQLDAGDLLLLYSDGLVERRGQSLDDGLAGLAAAAHGSGDPEQTVTAVLDALRSAEPEDDTCLVAPRSGDRAVTSLAGVTPAGRPARRTSGPATSPDPSGRPGGQRGRVGRGHRQPPRPPPAPARRRPPDHRHRGLQVVTDARELARPPAGNPPCPCPAPRSCR